jgi:hypothetical protein
MTAVKLGVTEMAYDAQVHYEEVRRKPWGITITYEPATQPAQSADTPRKK